jgi:hypothetical protein
MFDSNLAQKNSLVFLVDHQSSKTKKFSVPFFFVCRSEKKIYTHTHTQRFIVLKKYIYLFKKFTGIKIYHSIHHDEIVNVMMQYIHDRKIVRVPRMYLSIVPVFSADDGGDTTVVADFLDGFQSLEMQLEFFQHLFSRRHPGNKFLIDETLLLFDGFYGKVDRVDLHLVLRPYSRSVSLHPLVRHDVVQTRANQVAVLDTVRSIIDLRTEDNCRTRKSRNRSYLSNV